MHSKGGLWDIMDHGERIYDPDKDICMQFFYDPNLDQEILFKVIAHPLSNLTHCDCVGVCVWGGGRENMLQTIKLSQTDKQTATETKWFQYTLLNFFWSSIKKDAHSVSVVKLF